MERLSLLICLVLYGLQIPSLKTMNLSMILCFMSWHSAKVFVGMHFIIAANLVCIFEFDKVNESERKKNSCQKLI